MFEGTLKRKEDKEIIMGRPKTYDREEIAAKAMELFWLHGFNGTSTQALVEHMQINRYSLYAEFGSKQRLYEVALARYERDIVGHYFGALETSGAGLQEIREVIGFFAASARQPGSERGCLLCNSATERAPHDPTSRGFVEAYVNRIAKAFRQALDNAAGKGQRRPGVVTEDEGLFFASAMFGFFVLLRSQVNPSILRGAARGAIEHLERLRC